MRKKLFSILALLLVAATGAMAQTYTVTVKQGTKDTGKWMTDPKKANTTGVAQNAEVTVTYTGSKLVMSVKAKKKVAVPALPEGALAGKFTINAEDKQVYFSKGNLQAYCTKIEGDWKTPEKWTWKFADNQWDYVGDAVANTTINGYCSVSEPGTVDLFRWSTESYKLGIHNTLRNDYTGTFVDWGSDENVQKGIGTVWRTLTGGNDGEWYYLLNTRSVTYRYCKATVNGKTGLVIFPDNYSHPDGVTAVASANTKNAAFDSNTWDGTNWTQMETAGAVFLPAAGNNYENSQLELGIWNVGTHGYYWSSTKLPKSSNSYYYNNNAYAMYFRTDDLNTATGNYGTDRARGCSVRLVQELAQDADKVTMTPGATANTWSLTMPAYNVELEVEYFDLTAPTATEGDIYPGSSTALVTGGSSINGTLMYKVTAENTKPISTEGFKATVTAEDCPTAGTYYVWYYIDGTSVVSPIVDTAVEVTVIDTPENIVADMIRHLPDATDVTEDDYADIIAAREAYDALTKEQKSKVETVLVEKLAAAEDAMGQVYTVSVKQGTEDATNWTASPNPTKEGQTVTVTYTGSKLVKSLKAKKKLPEGALAGKFTINAKGKQVYFSKGNLQAKCESADNKGNTQEEWTWKFAEHQWDFIGDASTTSEGNGNTVLNGYCSVSKPGTVDLFRWSAGNYKLGIHNSTRNDYWGIFVDWGSDENVQKGIGKGWRTLTGGNDGEWNYLLNTRSVTYRYCKATVKSVTGLVIFPDGYSHPLKGSDINSPNTANAAYTTNSWSENEWTLMEAAGAVFLPAAGYNYGSVQNVGTNGYYWSSTKSPSNSNYAYAMYFNTNGVGSATGNYGVDRAYARSVRLVHE